MTSVVCTTQGGSVEAYDLDGSVQMIASLGIRCDRIHGNVDGRTGGGEIRLGKIGGWVQCASGGGSIFIDSVGGSARCETAGGEIVVREAGGPLLLTNASGNIEVDHAASTVEAHTGEGLIEVNQAGGEVIADTRGGSIQIGSAHGARCESAAGAIRVKNASGPLNVQTAMGSILAGLIAGSRPEESSLRRKFGRHHRADSVEIVVIRHGQERLGRQSPHRFRVPGNTREIVRIQPSAHARRGPDQRRRSLAADQRCSWDHLFEKIETVSQESESQNAFCNVHGPPCPECRRSCLRSRRT